MPTLSHPPLFISLSFPAFFASNKILCMVKYAARYKNAGGGIFVALPLRTHEGLRHRVLSPAPLTAWLPPHHAYIYVNINFFVIGRKLKFLIILALFKLYVLTKGVVEIHLFSFNFCNISVLHILYDS